MRRFYDRLLCRTLRFLQEGNVSQQDFANPVSMQQMQEKGSGESGMMKHSHTMNGMVSTRKERIKYTDFFTFTTLVLSVAFMFLWLLLTMADYDARIAYVSLFIFFGLLWVFIVLMNWQENSVTIEDVNDTLQRPKGRGIS